MQYHRVQAIVTENSQTVHQHLTTDSYLITVFIKQIQMYLAIGEGGLQLEPRNNTVILPMLSPNSFKVFNETSGNKRQSNSGKPKSTQCHKNWILFGTTRVRRYQKKHSPTHNYNGHQSSLICYLHLLRSTASSLFNLRALQSFSTFSLQVFFGLPLGLAPSTSYSIHFFTQSLSSFRSTCHTIATCFAVVLRL